MLRRRRVRTDGEHRSPLYPGLEYELQIVLDLRVLKCRLDP